MLKIWRWKLLKVSGMTIPTVVACLATISRAARFGTYPVFSIASRILARVSAFTYDCWLNTRETVDTETPASFATSLIFAMTSIPLPSSIYYIP